MTTSRRRCGADGVPNTLPTRADLDALIAQCPDAMHPAANPFGVIHEAALSDQQCDELVASIEGDDSCQVRRCGAQTRQYDESLDAHYKALVPLAQIALKTNRDWWDYELDASLAWLQTYETGGDYLAHMDASPGQSRKLTAVAMIADPADYEGGDLTIRAVPRYAEFKVPRARGTVVVFQPWLIHDVSAVTAGVRRTVNLGFWGPSLR